MIASLSLSLALFTLAVAILAYVFGLDNEWIHFGVHVPPLVGMIVAVRSLVDREHPLGYAVTALLLNGLLLFFAPLVTMGGAFVIL